MPWIPDYVGIPPIEDLPWRLATFARLQRSSGFPRSVSRLGRNFHLAFEARSNRVSILIATATACSCVIWVLASTYIVPGVIRSAYYGTSWAFLNRMITNQASEPLRHYLAVWSAFAWRVLLEFMLGGLAILLAARPEVQNAFWKKWTRSAA